MDNESACTYHKILISFEFTDDISRLLGSLDHINLKVVIANSLLNNAYDEVKSLN